MLLNSLATGDGLTWLAIIVKTMAYASTLVASGSVLFALAIGPLPTQECNALRRVAVISVFLAAISSAFRLPLRAAFLVGGTWDGALDPTILSIVAESPLGTSIAIRFVGLFLILAIVLPGRVAGWVAAIGALAAAASFAFRGHALEDPRVLLGVLITLHVLGLAFWIGGFAPLYRAADGSDSAVAGALAHAFGRKALWVVGALFVAGVLTFALLAGGSLTVLSTPYGQFFVIKLALFLVIMALAAWNRILLTPALLHAKPYAATRLRRSIGVEASLITAVLLTTAVLTTITAPP